MLRRWRRRIVGRRCRSLWSGELVGYVVKYDHTMNGRTKVIYRPWQHYTLPMAFDTFELPGKLPWTPCSYLRVLRSRLSTDV